MKIESGQFPDKQQSRRQNRQASSVDLNSLWFAFRRQWFLILVCSATLCVFAGIGVWKFLPPSKANAYVIYEISPNTPSILSRLPDDREFNSFRQFQSNLVTKRSVLAAVLDDPGVVAIKECTAANDQFRWLEDKLKIDFKMGREYMRVNADLPNPQEALALIKAVHKNFMYEAVNKEKERRADQIAHLRQVHEAKSKMLEEELDKRRDLGVKGGAANDQIAALQNEYIRRELSQIQQDRLLLASEIRRLRIELTGRTSEAAKAKTSEPPEHLILAELNSNQEMRVESGVLSDLERQLKAYQDALHPGVSTPRLEELKQSVAAQKALVEGLPKRLRSSAVEAAKAKHLIASGADKGTLESRLAIAEKLEKKLEEDEARLNGNVKQLSSTQHFFERSRVHISELEKTTQELAVSVAKMDIERDAPDRVTLFQEPTVTLADDASRRTKFALMAAIGGLVIGAAPFWIRELGRKIFHEESQLLNAVPVPLIGTIPRIPKKQLGAGAPSRMRALVAESIDSTRATVLFNLQATGGRSIMVTSAVAGEGKSSVSGHIAISLARAGFRTLIIDSDMRCPTLHRVFGVEKSLGFSDVLLERCALEEAVRPTPLENLSILPAGEWSPAASASLTGSAWSGLLNVSKERFDLVIVDSPPVLLVADSLSMAGGVDALLISTLSGVSEIDLVNRSVEKLQSLGISPLGMIASGVKHRTYSARYYDRYASAVAPSVKG